MKALNQFLGLFFITILIGMTSCTKQDLEINENAPAATKKVSSNVLDIVPILVDNTIFNASSDFFTAVNFTIEDEIIMLTVDYSAGCTPVQFRLVADPQVKYSSDNTPFFESKLILDNNDKCSYSIKETVGYNLTPLKQTGHSKVILKVANFGEVLYNY